MNDYSDNATDLTEKVQQFSDMKFADGYYEGNRYPTEHASEFRCESDETHVKEHYSSGNDVFQFDMSRELTKTAVPHDDDTDNESSPRRPNYT